jgi:hypothetical protein
MYYEALIEDGSWAEVELHDFLVIRGVVKAIVSLVGSGPNQVQILPLEELRTRHRPEGTQWSWTPTFYESGTIEDDTITVT